MGDADELKALAEKLMTQPHPEGPTSIELLLRSLPDEWGATPAPPNAELLGSALHSRRGRPAQIEAIFTAEGNPQSVVDRYDGALKGGGWEVFAGFGRPHGGFMPGGLAAAHQSYRYKDEGPILMVAAMEDEPVVTDLRLRLDWEMVRHLPEPPMRGRPEGWERIPPLAPPAGVPLRGGGGGGGSGSWHSEATVETDLPVPDLEVHFSRQLEAAGWARLAGTADDVAGWSSWRLPGEGEWGGILLVLAAFKANERFLYIRVAAGDAGDGGGYTSGMLIARG
jgi:hypothetical protein